jgi:ribosome-associated toxin RatA of RatAB toxin-antitoxin module
MRYYASMRHIHRSALVALSPQRMFDLINDIARYPEFVPGCSAARVLHATPERVHAELTVGSGVMKTTFSTINLLQPPGLIQMQLQSGPLRRLGGQWVLTPIESAAVSGCRVELDLAFEPDAGLAALAMAPLVERLATTLVQAFVARARALAPVP